MMHAAGLPLVQLAETKVAGAALHKLYVAILLGRYRIPVFSHV